MNQTFQTLHAYALTALNHENVRTTYKQKHLQDPSVRSCLLNSSFLTKSNLLDVLFSYCWTILRARGNYATKSLKSFVAFNDHVSPALYSVRNWNGKHSASKKCRYVNTFILRHEAQPVNPRNSSAAIELHNCTLFFPAVQTHVVSFLSFSNTHGYSVQCVWYPALFRAAVLASTLRNCSFLEKRERCWRNWKMFMNNGYSQKNLI